MIPVVLAALAFGAIPATASADTVTLTDTYNHLLCGVWDNLPAGPSSAPGPTTCGPSSDYSQVGVALGSFNLQPLNPLTEPVAITTQQVSNTTPTQQSQTVTYSQSLTQSNSLTTTVGVAVSASSTESFDVLLAKVSETITVMANFSQAIGYSSSQSKTFSDATTINVPPGCTYSVSSWIEQATYSPTYTATVLLTGTANNSVLYGDTRTGLVGPYSLSMQTLASDLQYYANAANWPALYGYTNVNVGGLAGDTTFQSGLSDLSQAGWTDNAGGNAIVGNVSGVWNGLEGTQADSSYYIDKCNAQTASATDRPQAASARGPRIGYHRKASRHGGLLRGSPGRDLLEGGPGADHIVGLGGNDFMFAGRGNDTVDAGGRSDYVDGGPGNDTIRLTGPRRAIAAFRDMSGLDFKGERRITVFGGRPVHVDRVDRGTTDSTLPTARRSG